ncbi:DUF3800 domain-containing protein [Runella sp. SP2]|uniref:DUF3800 domain-containing protein n=1 Tax=Runella sp. SP2 TaxID=2268026 RepID=UPI000F07CD0C|nr:DUF3800 domain-containing protein [Runella sp. SP2]AYQ32993.1 DUF3800 domain-containing protein [Runella sp. SP2]
MNYKIFSDERYNNNVIYIGGIFCTSEREHILLPLLQSVKENFNCEGEFKWTKISKRSIIAYKQWLNIFFDDPHVRFLIFKIDKNTLEWRNFENDSGYRNALISVYIQFLLSIFKTKSDNNIGWFISHDFGFFKKDTDIKSIEIKLNKVYKRSLPNRKRVIQLSKTIDSKKDNLIQLSDLLIGSLDYTLNQIEPESQPKNEFLTYFRNYYSLNLYTKNKLKKNCHLRLG